MQTQANWWRRWPRWFRRASPRQVNELRGLLAELPLCLMHADGALPRFLDRFEALQPGVTLNLIQVDEDLGPARRVLTAECERSADCPWRSGACVTTSPVACDPCRQRGVHRLICGLPEARVPGSAMVLLDTPREADRFWQQMLGEVSEALGVTVQLLRHRREQQRKQATAQHGALARELHDSVAQQLGYLSFQARLVQTRLTDPELAGTSLTELRNGLSQLQRQVRELITSARLTMDGRSLRQALADSVAEFSRRCIIVFELDNRLPDNALSPETELQILQIIREALTNAVRHSHARHVRIELRQPPSGDVLVSVEDDGIGLSSASGDDNHFGLAIIRERAASIGARLAIEPIQPHGVRVHLWLTCHPADFSESHDARHDLVTDR
ncbi:sensor histidine kinase [Pseudomonas sp. NPDC088444]|uniref:sensor histidine kinase n=1 Tax=Pseudomonas sp. NPDC088444 TaxID=3364456 RepID=UPI00384F6C81